MSVHRELDERLAAARLGGSEAARDKQKAAGRLLVRERLALLLDGEPDFEDGLLARTEEGLAGDAVVTAVGKVDGRPVAVIANDFTVKAGTWGRRTYEKITHLQERADALGIPIVYLVDAAGARIDEQFDSYAGRHAWGNIFTNLVRFSGRVPQVCALFGPSPAGSAYVPALFDAVVAEATFFAYTDLFAPELVCGFARLGGRPVGVLANQSLYKAGVLFSDSSDKAARFIWICNAFNVPLLFLADNAGFMVGADVERTGIIRHGAKMLFAVCQAAVPRISVIVRKAYGGGYLAMSGSPTFPDAVVALPTAKVALMGPAAAVNAIHYNRIMAIEDEAERARWVEEQRAAYEADIDVFKVASENAFEAVVPVAQLRDDLIARFAAYRRRS